MFGFVLFFSGSQWPWHRILRAEMDFVLPWAMDGWLTSKRPILLGRVPTMLPLDRANLSLMTLSWQGRVLLRPPHSHLLYAINGHPFCISVNRDNASNHRQEPWFDQDRFLRYPASADILWDNGSLSNQADVGICGSMTRRWAGKLHAPNCWKIWIKIMIKIMMKTIKIMAIIDLV